MKFKTKAALKLAKLAKIDLASQALDDVTMHFLDGNELAEGVEVFDMNEEGEYITFPDGSYPWGEDIVIVENGIVASIKPKENSEEEMTKKEKLEGDVVTVEDFNDLIEVVNEVIDEVEKMGGDVDPAPMLEELEATKEKLSAIEKELGETKKSLELAKQTSKADFTDPEGKDMENKKFDASAELKKFGL